jgi:hypothetical protein
MTHVDAAGAAISDDCNTQRCAPAGEHEHRTDRTAGLATATRLGCAPPILGVDPGITGGVAFLYSDHVFADDIPVVGGEVDVDTLVRRIREHAPRVAVIERAQAMPRQGVVSVFKYGTAFGALCAVTAICEIPTHLVSPRKWKTHFGLDANKEKSRALAIRLWPGCGYFERKKDHGRSEAALLARYGAEVLDQVRR